MKLNIAPVRCGVKQAQRFHGWISIRDRHTHFWFIWQSLPTVLAIVWLCMPSFPTPLIFYYSDVRGSRQQLADRGFRPGASDAAEVPGGAERWAVTAPAPCPPRPARERASLSPWIQRGEHRDRHGSRSRPDERLPAPTEREALVERVTVVGAAAISAGAFVQASGTWVNDRTQGCSSRPPSCAPPRRPRSRASRRTSPRA
jgi:hypothetical protein